MIDLNMLNIYKDNSKSFVNPCDRGINPSVMALRIYSFNSLLIAGLFCPLLIWPRSTS